MKKLSFILIAVVSLVSMAVPTFAAQSSPQKTADTSSTAISSAQEPNGPEYDSPMPMYLVIQKITVAPNFSATSVSSSASIKLYSSYKCTASMVLEVSKDGGRTYTTDKTLDSKTQTGTSVTLTGSKSGLNSAYKYRIKTTVSVYDASGSRIDGDTVYNY